MLFIAVLLTATVVPQIFNIKSVSADDGGYPWIDAHALYASPDYSSSYGYALPCPAKDTQCDQGGSSLMGTVNGVTYGEADTWHYGLRNCTSYAAWKINQVFGVTNIAGWGNGYQWDTGYINTQPYTVYNASGHTPQVGEIAQWEIHTGDSFGHVAYVWKVETNGVADLMEYNQAYDGLFTSTRTTASGSDGTPDHYIHIGTVSSSTPGLGGGNASSWSAGRLDGWIAQATPTNGSNLGHIYVDSSWHPWETVPVNTQLMASQPAVVSWGVNRIDVFARGQAGDLIHAWLDSGTWHTWESLSGCIIGAPTVTSWGANRLDVMAEGCNTTGSNLYHKWLDSSGWHPWEQITSITQPMTSPPAVGIQW